MFYCYATDTLKTAIPCKHCVTLDMEQCTYCDAYQSGWVKPHYPVPTIPLIINLELIYIDDLIERTNYSVRRWEALRWRLRLELLKDTQGPIM